MQPVVWKNHMSHARKWLWYFQFFRFPDSDGSLPNNRLRAAVKAFRMVMGLGYRCRLRGGW
jgi:hypothetical protein